MGKKLIILVAMALLLLSVVHGQPGQGHTTQGSSTRVKDAASANDTASAGQGHSAQGNNRPTDAALANGTASTGNAAMRPPPKNFEEKMARELEHLGLNETSLRPRGPLNDKRFDTVLGFVGNRGQFRIYPPSATNSSSWIFIKFGKISEVGPNKSELRGRYIVFGDRDVSTFVTGTELYQGQNLTYVDLSLNLSSVESSTFMNGCSVAPRADALIAFRVYMGFTNITTYTYGPADNQKTVTVQPGGVKWNFNAAYWPFCSPSNSLSIDFIFHSKNEEMPEHAENPDMQGNMTQPPPCNVTAAAGAADACPLPLDAPTYSSELRVDNTTKTVLTLPLVAYDTAVNSSQVYNVTAGMPRQSNSVVVRITFPYFNSTLFYDPEASITTGTVSAAPGGTVVRGVDMVSSPDATTSKQSGLSANEKVIVGVVVGVGGALVIGGIALGVFMMRGKSKNANLVSKV